MKNKKHISIRIDETILKKFHHISKYDDRSASGQIMYLINKSIHDFEKAHGEINLHDENAK